MNAHNDDPVLAMTQDASVGLLVARQSGVHVSFDNGHSWQPTWTEGFAATVVVTRDPAGEPMMLAGVQGGVICSRDGGVEWAMYGFPDPSPLVTSIAQVAEESGPAVLLAGSYQDGVFRSDDEGRSWVRSNPGMYVPRITALQAAGCGKVFAAAESCLFQSRNGGRSWDDVDGLTLDDDITALGGDANYLLVGTEDGDVHICDLQPGTWERIAVTPARPVLALAVASDERGQRILVMTERAVHELDMLQSGFWADANPRRLTMLTAAASIGCFQKTGTHHRAYVGLSDGTIEIVDVAVANQR